ncbi:MAG TPA: kynureninase [Chthonomonadales bacterium]|nr:kynureninase [Chthonomonadales bacterium]
MPLAEIPGNNLDAAGEADRCDALSPYRDRFHLPSGRDGQPLIYFCSHSLGLQPKTVRPLIECELDQWARFAVEGHFHGASPWYTYQESMRQANARLVGALPHEVILMNGLTVNLHLMLTSFYQPNRERFKILIDEPAFPSDLYAIKTHLAVRGYDPQRALLSVKPRIGSDHVELADVERLLEAEGYQIALVLWSGLNFLTGQLFDIPMLTALVQRHGCRMGLDLAHAAGNVPLRLHEWNVDFAVWCPYKYLCGGPGSIAGCFVHERHGRSPFPRLAGWWGNDPQTRFRMQLQPEFVPQPGADGWQVSNPPILALVPVRAALDIFEEVGLAALRNKSIRLTGYLDHLLQWQPIKGITPISPARPSERGCQLSLRVQGDGSQLTKALLDAGAVVDFRQPDIIRVAPAPLYNTFVEVYRFWQILSAMCQ